MTTWPDGTIKSTDNDFNLNRSGEIAKPAPKRSKISLGKNANARASYARRAAAARKAKEENAKAVHVQG